jgi:hypothetical protein
MQPLQCSIDDATTRYRLFVNLSWLLSWLVARSSSVNIVPPGWAFQEPLPTLALTHTDNAVSIVTTCPTVANFALLLTIAPTIIHHQYHKSNTPHILQISPSITYTSNTHITTKWSSCQLSLTRWCKLQPSTTLRCMLDQPLRT